MHMAIGEHMAARCDLHEGRLASAPVECEEDEAGFTGIDGQSQSRPAAHHTRSEGIHRSLHRDLTLRCRMRR